MRTVVFYRYRQGLPLGHEHFKRASFLICTHVSQPVFDRYLNTSASTVKKWESGEKQPSGMALKLLSIVQKHGLEILA